MNKYTITCRNSSGIVRAVNHAAAIERAKVLGFNNILSCVLVTDKDADKTAAIKLANVKASLL